MSDLILLYVLRILHIVVGVFWVGSVVFLSAFLTPSIRAAGPAGGAVMQQLMGARRTPIWLMAASIITLLSGIGLYWHDSGGFQSAWLGSGPGKTFGLGGALGIVAAVIGMAVNSPTARQLATIIGGAQAAGRPPSADEQATMARLQARLSSVSKVTSIMLLLATMLMAVARYVP
jgi:uncharacterized membrane protein